MLRSSTHLNRSVHIISRISHFIKPSYLLSGGWKITRNPTKLPYINKASFAPSAGQLRILLLLLLLQMVHSLDVHTCSLLDTVFTCLLVILCWRPHFILIPVAVIVVLLLFWWAAHRAYRALSDTLVKVVIHLIILSLWGAGLFVLCVEGLGLDSSTFLDWFAKVPSQAATYSADSFNEATCPGISYTRTL
jgi:hypothetical protein